VVEEDSGLESQTRGSGEPISEFDGHEGIESELLERPMGLESIGRGESQDGGGFCAHQVEQGLLAVVGSEREESLGE
jgi:hypothetical protein